MAMTEEDAKMD